MVSWSGFEHNHNKKMFSKQIRPTDANSYTVKARGTEKVPKKVHNQKGTKNIP